MAAFHDPGSPLMLYPPVLGQRSVQWPEVFALIRQPRLLWDTWKPNKSLDQMDLETLWCCWNTGEPKLDHVGEPTGMKPPLRIVEQYFHAKWRASSSVSSLCHCA